MSPSIDPTYKTFLCKCHIWTIVVDKLIKSIQPDINLSRCYTNVESPSLLSLIRKLSLYQNADNHLSKSITLYSNIHICIRKYLDALPRAKKKKAISPEVTVFFISQLVDLLYIHVRNRAYRALYQTEYHHLFTEIDTIQKAISDMTNYIEETYCSYAHIPLYDKTLNEDIRTVIDACYDDVLHEMIKAKQNLSIGIPQSPDAKTYTPQEIWDYIVKKLSDRGYTPDDIDTTITWTGTGVIPVKA